LAFYAVGPRKDQLKCFNLINGKSVWQRRLFDAASGAVIADGKLIVGSGDGLILALNPADGEIIWHLQTECRLTVASTFSDGIIYQPGDKNVLYAVSSDDGSMVYQLDLDAPPMSAAVVADKIYVTDIKGKVYALDKKDGQRVWQNRLAGPIWTSPAVAEGRLFVGHSGGELVALDASTGDVLWTFTAVDVVRASPVVAGQFVVFGTMSGRLISLNARDGSLVQERDLGGPIAIAPVTDGNNIYVATDKGVISCLGPPIQPTSIASQ
jgi:outer membrane protein assembly factor BamB